MASVHRSYCRISGAAVLTASSFGIVMLVIQSYFGMLNNRFNLDWVLRASSLDVKKIGDLYAIRRRASSIIH